VRLVCPRPRHVTLVPDAIITFMAGTITDRSLPSAPLLPSSTPTPTSGPDPVPSPTIPLDPAPSVSSHSAETLSAETLSIPITISSAPAIASVPSPRLSPVTVPVPATPAFGDGADPVPDKLVAKKSAVKLTAKLERWWSDHREDVVSGVKTVLEVASKVLEDVPAGGAIAAKVLDFGLEALENVQVMRARQ
jgi:hypothetical protein